MKNKGGTRVGRFRGSPMKPRRGAQEEIDRVHREREREGGKGQREEEKFTIYPKGHFFFSPSFAPCSRFHKRVEKDGRTAGRGTAARIKR